MKTPQGISTSKFFQTIADEAIMGILAFTLPEMNCIYVNSLARGILEIDPDASADDIKIDDLKPKSPRDNFRNFSEELFALEGLIRDVQMEKMNDIPFIADLGVKKVKRGKNEILLLMFQDVTIQKKLQRELTTKQQAIHSAYEELLGQNKQLKELDLAKDKFISLTTHELRTPIAAMIATADVLKLGLYDTDEERDEFIDTVHDQAMHLMTLVNDILDFAKIQAGKMDFFIEEKCIREGSLDLHVGNFKQMAEAKGIELVYEVPESPLICYFDHVRIGEVFSNVINNAIKFSPENTKIHIDIKSENNCITVSIADQGPGIPPEKVESVFNEFETVGAINTHHKGTGLGMPISKRIMDAHGGKIFLETEVNKGTTFFIEIPATKILAEDEYKDRPEDVDDLLKTV